MNEKRLCPSCNQQVDIIGVDFHPAYEEQKLSCGHTGKKIIIPTINEPPIVSGENLEAKVIRIEPISGQNFVMISGETGGIQPALISGFQCLQVANTGTMNNCYFYLPMTYVTQTTSIATMTTQEIVTKIEQTTYSQLEKDNIKEIVKYVEDEAKSTPLSHYSPFFIVEISSANVLPFKGPTRSASVIFPLIAIPCLIRFFLLSLSKSTIMSPFAPTFPKSLVYAAVIRGTTGNDNLSGTLKDDNIEGLRGDDNIVGLGGNDVIEGSQGNDILKGSEGNDYLNGGQGSDMLYGEIGNDELNGAEGRDQLFGGPGDDVLYGSISNDIINGDEGNDRLYGGPGNDTLTGGDGADYFNCGVGSDKVTDYNPAEGDSFIGCEIVTHI